MGTPPPIDLERREPLWIALAELWLDTELTGESLRAIAAAVRRSGYSRREVEDILRYELAPLLDANLRSVAGEWRGFERSWLCAAARARIGRRGLMARLGAWVGRSPCPQRRDWRRIREWAFGAPAE